MNPPFGGGQTERVIMGGMGMGGGGMGTLQALLSEMDGLKKPRGLTNRPPAARDEAGLRRGTDPPHLRDEPAARAG